MGERDRIKKFDTRIGVLQSCFVFGFAILLLYLFFLQVIDFRHYRERAQRQYTRKVSILRGDIVDRNNIKLVSNKVTYNIYAHPKYYNHTPSELAEILAPYLKINKSTLTKKLSDTSKKHILIKKDLDRITTNQIMKLGLREISKDVKNKRIYPQDSLAAHILGYYNPSADVSSGVEYTAKKYLESGVDLSYQKTGKGDVIYNLGTDPETIMAPPKGPTLKLTIDSAIQHISEKALYKMIKQTNARRGAVIVMDTKSGEILAMAVYPTYDPNKYNKYSLTNVKNWTLTDVYPPGSTFKILTVASGMILNKINKNSKILDTGKMKIGWWDIKNYDYSKNPYPGYIDLVYLFQHSSNVASAKIALMLDKQEYYDVLSSFNLGRKTGIDLPGESIGLLPKPRRWEVATHASMGHGYGASVTAIQMISAVNAVANKGVWVTPHVIKYSEKELEEKVVRRQVMSESIARDLTDLMVKSVDKGKQKIDHYSIAAKTGTSKRPNDSGVGYTDKLYTSMIGFLPAGDPKVTIYVIVDSANGGGIWGSTVAGPIFRDVALDVIKILNINPDK